MGSVTQVLRPTIGSRPTTKDLVSIWGRPTVPGALPACFPNVALWVRADAGVTLNGSNVSGLADQSGAGNSLGQGSAGKQPPVVASAQNFRSAIRFDGVDDTLTRNSTNLFGSGAYTMFVALKVITAATNTHYFSNGIATAGVSLGDVAGNRNILHQNVENHADGAIVTTPETWIASRAAGGNPAMLVNGVSVSVSTTSNTLNDPGGTANLCLGSFADVSSWANLDVYEAGAYTRSLSNMEQLRLAAFLRGGWNTP